jgi:hypothetical protein
MASSHRAWGKKGTHAFLLISLDNSESTLVLSVLHDEPRQRLAVLL